MPTKKSNGPHGSARSAGTPDRLGTGRLILSGLSAFGYHGNHPAERKLGQTFVADIEVVLDTRPAARSDRLQDTLSYPVVERIAREILEGKPSNLLETVAERIATEVLKQPKALQVTVRISKRPPLPHLESFSVEITRPVETPESRR